MAKRALFVVTHLLGVGHLARTAAIARAFARAGHEATLVSGGMPARLVPLDGIDLVQLPPVRSDGVNFSRLLDRDGRPVGPEYLAARRHALLTACDAARPDIVVTELFPFGRRQLAGEFLAMLDHVRTWARPPRIAASIRDVLVAPARQERIEETHSRLHAHYGIVLVHGDARVLPLETSWPAADAIASMLRYTGYIDAQPGSAPPTGNGAGKDEVIVSGGGSAAGLPLFRESLAAARLVPELRWRILAGHALPEDDMRFLAGTAPRNVALERARSDFPALLEGCAVSISQAGYNTMMDLLRARARAVVIPFESGNETEQRIRAEHFARLGLVAMLPEADLSGPALAEAVRRAHGAPRPSVTAIDRDGLARSVALLLALADARP